MSNILTKLSSILFGNQITACPANSPNTECSLIKELREMQEKKARFEEKQKYEVNIEKYHHIITFRISLSLPKGVDGYELEKKEIVDKFPELFPNAMEMLELHFRIKDIKKQLGIT